MLKHIGTHNSKKVVLLFREVPGEEHMCLVSYSDLLPRLYHDTVMTVLESAPAQNSQSLADVLHRNMMPDGKNCLEALHTSGLIKKVPCNQVLVTPNRTSSVRLDELNSILNEMAKGEAAVKKLAEIDSQQGMAANRRRSTRTSAGDVGEPVPTTVTQMDAVLSDSDLAGQRVRQAETMKADAARLLKEAEALLAEAAQLDPSVNGKPKKKTTATKTKKS